MDIFGRPRKVFGVIGGSIPSPCTMLIAKDLLTMAYEGNNISNNLSFSVHTYPAASFGPLSFWF